MPFLYREAGGVGFYEASGWEGARGVFTTRKGGVSPAPFASLNLGSGGGDSPALVEENRALLAGALGVTPAALKTVSQVHGADIHVVEGPDAPRPDAGYDAMVTDVPGVALAVLTADCVPVLLYDPKRRAVGAVHAGWAGTVRGIAGHAVEKMVERYGSRPGDVMACIGPSIGACCYEVDDKVVGPLSEAMGGWLDQLLSPSRPGHWFLDLWKANAKALSLAGLRPDNIRVLGLCTACNPGKFYSHRKSGGRTGRMMGVAMVSGARG